MFERKLVSTNVKNSRVVGRQAHQYWLLFNGNKMFLIICVRLGSRVQYRSYVRLREKVSTDDDTDDSKTDLQSFLSIRDPEPLSS